MSEELKWIEAVRAGDFDSFRHIVSQYKNALYSVAYGILGDYHLAEDAAQESFLQAFLALQDLRDPDKIGSWLYSITYRTNIRMKKKSKWLEVQHDFSDMAIMSESVEATVLRREDHAQIWHSISGLDEKNRITTVLFYMCNLSMKEIADFLRVSVRAVESRLQRAKKQLRSSLLTLDEVGIRKPLLGQSFNERIMREIPQLLRIPCVFVDVRDVDYAMAWYESVLGIDFNSREPKVGVNISFRETSLSSPSHDPILTFATASIMKAYSALQSMKVNINQFSTDGRSFMFADPYGNILAFVEE
jgi:RNA polymerase sigma-70 factor (ECF subfamily)